MSVRLLVFPLFLRFGSMLQGVRVYHAPMDGPTPRSLQSQDPPGLAAARQRRLTQAWQHALDEKRFRRWSWWFGVARLVVFAVLVVLVVASLRDRPGLFVSGFLPVAALFGSTVWLHQRIRQRQETARRQRLLATESAARLAGAQGPGSVSDPPLHPASALDAGLAGLVDEGRVQELSPWVLTDLGIEADDATLLAHLNTTQSEFGARRLRQLLRRPLLDANAIRARQAAVRELAEDEAWRDALHLAYFAGRGVRIRRLPAFLAAPRRLPGGVFRVAVAMTGVLPTPLLLVAWLWPWARPWALPAAVAVLAAALALRFRVRAHLLPLRDAYLELQPVLRKCIEVARVVTTRGAQAELLRQQQEILAQYTAPDNAAQLQRLLRYVRCLHLQEVGILYGFIDFLTQWDLQWLLALEANARSERAQFERIAIAAADLEAWLALAVHAAERPGLCEPEICDSQTPQLEIEAGIHPLMAADAVPNDVALGLETRLLLVTGSNMAGKSTFLRMVALNCILAQVGTLARGRRMRLAPLALHANINVHDSLADGKSYFLVEVERVRDILRAAAADRHVLGIFDELYRGTNSTERLAASREVTRTLAASGGLFLLATHDAELTRLASDEQVEGISVVHFRDEIRDGVMVFPYRAHPGIAAPHNAIRLLELSGYPAGLVARARAFAESKTPRPKEPGGPTNS